MLLNQHPVEAGLKSRQPNSSPGESALDSSSVPRSRIFRMGKPGHLCAFGENIFGTTRYLCNCGAKPVIEMQNRGENPYQDNKVFTIN